MPFAPTDPHAEPQNVSSREAYVVGGSAPGSPQSLSQTEVAPGISQT